jgi:hypothetical protein
VTIAAPTVEFGRLLRARLAPFMRRAPSITIPRSAACG